MCRSPMAKVWYALVPPDEIKRPVSIWKYGRKWYV